MEIIQPISFKTIKNFPGFSASSEVNIHYDNTSEYLEEFWLMMIYVLNCEKRIVAIIFIKIAIIVLLSFYEKSKGNLQLVILDEIKK